jgi:hypothetical protein
VFTGKRFVLKATSIGIESIGNHREAVQVPAGETVVVVSGPQTVDSRLLDVLWNDKSLMMFVDDIQAHAREIDNPSRTDT